MRHPSPLPRIVAGGLAAALSVAGFLATPAAAAPHGAHATRTAPAVRSTPAPRGRDAGATQQDTTQQHRLTPAQRPPASPLAAHQDAHAGIRPHAAGTASAAAAVQSCTPADFGGRSGAALVSYVEASSTDCVNSLFTVTGADAAKVFAESQMVTVANALTGAAASYPGDDSTGVWQLVLFLRAGYYVQYYDSADVGNYDGTLAKAIEPALDAFFADSHSREVTAANGDVLGETVVLTDSANEQARYLGVYQSLLNGYDSNSYDPIPSMVNAVNDVYTPLWRGHGNPAFVSAVTADPSLLTTLHAFALNHEDLLGGADAFLDANAGLELGRFVQHTQLQSQVRPLMKSLLDGSAITGRTAPLWVAVAGDADAYDQANCAYYGTCNLVQQLTAAALPITHPCDAAHTIQAQSLSAADLDTACTSVLNQDAFFHGLVKDNGPIPGQYESTIKLVVFASRTDYQTYAGPIFGVDTNNGGITLSGNPSDPANQPISIMYIKSVGDGFPADIWNLNHEYTHHLDAVYDMKGDFSAQISVPDIWWIEGLAEYVSYSYRGIADTQAMAEAAKHTYALSTLWQSTYANSDTTRTYPWGYLAVRYMFEKHPQDIAAMLSHFRTGDYQGGYAVYNTGIGTGYDADFNSWLSACAAGACAQQPTLPECTGADTRALGQDCARSNQSATAGNTDYFYLWLPAGTTTLHVDSHGGTGTAYLLYNPDTWAVPNAYTVGSTNSGTTQSLTVTNTTAGYRYVSLYAETDFSGVTVTTQY